jgi:surface protein
MSQCFDQGSSFPFLFLPFVTVFYHAKAFNGDLSLWDVAKVTTMWDGKSICIVENDLT